MPMQLKIVTPEKEVFNSEVEMVTVPSAEGELGILPHHISLMAKLIPGELQIKHGSKTDVMATGAGFLQVADNIVTILTDLAVDAKDIDEKVVEAARERAQKALEQTQSDEEYAETKIMLEKSLAQLKIKRRHRV
jgi:F-type H+-transporting ATPase subunit epsilon